MNNISFIIPAYNCAQTIEETIRSIIDGGNFEDGDEIIITNDCSTDTTQEVLNNLCKKYFQQKILVINHVFNKGGASARNTSIEHANNNLIFCLDSDNVLAPNSILRLKTFLIDKKVDVASFGELRYFKDNIKHVTHNWTFQNTLVTLADVLSNPVVPGSSGNYLFTKESWIRAGRYPEFAGALDAWGLGFRQVATGSKMMAMPGSFYYHRYGHDSYWMRDSKKRGFISLVALQIVLPFINKFHDGDVDYMMSARGRYVWYVNLAKHPIRLKKEQVDDTYVKESKIKRIARKMYRVGKNLYEKQSAKK